MGDSVTSLFDLTTQAVTSFDSRALILLRCFIYLLGARYVVRSHADNGVPVRLAITTTLSLGQFFFVINWSDNCGANVTDHYARRLRVVEEVAGVLLLGVGGLLEGQDACLSLDLLKKSSAHAIYQLIGNKLVLTRGLREGEATT